MTLFIICVFEGRHNNIIEVNFHSDYLITSLLGYKSVWLRCLLQHIIKIFFQPTMSEMFTIQSKNEFSPCKTQRRALKLHFNDVFGLSNFNNEFSEFFSIYVKKCKWNLHY